MLSIAIACDTPKAPTPHTSPVAPDVDKAKPPAIKEDVQVNVQKPKPKPAHAQAAFDLGPHKLYISPIQHGTLYMQWGDKIVYVDPVQGAMDTIPKDQPAPKADIVLLTDIHGDHLDPSAVKPLMKPDTIVIAPKAVQDKVNGDLNITHVLANGASKALKGTEFTVHATPMYNLKRTKPNTQTPFHVKGRGNGYIIEHKQGGRVYVSGDTECTTEMRELKAIDVAFVTMNLPYTMPVQEAAECIKAFKPKRIVPFHFRGQDPKTLKTLLADHSNIKLHLLEWYPKSAQEAKSAKKPKATHTH